MTGERGIIHGRNRDAVEAIEDSKREISTDRELCVVDRHIELVRQQSGEIHNPVPFDL